MYISSDICLESPTSYTGGMDHDALFVTDTPQQAFLIKLAPALRVHGLAGLRVEDMARHMDISRATFYKYFSSKDDVVTQFVDLCNQQLISNQPTSDGPVDVAWYLAVVQRMFLLATFGPARLVNDIATLYPQAWDNVQRALLARNHRLAAAYRQAMADGILRPACPYILIAQDEQFFEQISRPTFLVRHNISATQAVNGYFVMRIGQLFAKPDQWLPLPEEVNAALDHLADKLRLTVGTAA